MRQNNEDTGRVGQSEAETGGSRSDTGYGYGVARGDDPSDEVIIPLTDGILRDPRAGSRGEEAVVHLGGSPPPRWFTAGGGQSCYTGSVVMHIIGGGACWLSYIF